MTKKALLEKIEGLAPEERAEVEDFVDFVAKRARELKPGASKLFPDDLFKRINERREQLSRDHGLFPDSTATIRNLREQSE